MTDLSKTVDKMILIMTTLGDGRVASARELSESLGINRTVVQRLLATLQAQDFVARLGSDGYALSLRLQGLGEHVLPQLRRAARPVARDLATSLGATVTVHVADGVESVVIAEQLPAGAAIQVRHRVGSRNPLERGAGGKALLAFADGPTIRKAGAGMGDELAEIRRAGHAMSRQAVQQGVKAIAAPLHDAAGNVIASLALLFPDERETDLFALRTPLTVAARQIDRRYSDFRPVSTDMGPSVLP